jgi:hypothetical protein
MKLMVLYTDDGRIISLSRVTQTPEGPGGRSPLISGVEPAHGQHAAVIEADESLRDYRLSDIHERFSVAHHEKEPRLVARADEAHGRKR